MGVRKTGYEGEPVAGIIRSAWECPRCREANPQPLTRGFPPSRKRALDKLICQTDSRVLETTVMIALIGPLMPLSHGTRK
jgi:hypothetical protein